VYEERGEIRRVIEEFLGQSSTEENIKRVVELLESAPMEELTEQMWARLENSDSYDVAPGDIEKVKSLLEEHDRDLPPEKRRDLAVIENGFKQGLSMKAPMILERNDRLHLVSGNTRLMVSRAFGARPQVIIGKV
jgi:hypothetical protein